MVCLPLHIARSAPYEYDLTDRRWLLSAYQRVLSEGLEADVLWFIDTLLEVWGELHLSPHVREPWERWLRDRGLLD